MAALPVVRVSTHANHDAGLEQRVREVLLAIRQTIAESQTIQEQARDYVNDLEAIRAPLRRPISD